MKFADCASHQFPLRRSRKNDRCGRLQGRDLSQQRETGLSGVFSTFSVGDDNRACSGD
jgi:hypothetical protein